MKAFTNLALALGAILTLPQATTSLPTSPDTNTTLLLQARDDDVPSHPTAEAGNPFLPGFYTDPDIAVYDGVYWVFVAPSPVSERCFQHYFDAYASLDMVNWVKYDKVLERATFHQDGAYHWATCALRSPTPVSRDGKYYLYFAAGDPEHDLAGGLGVGVADRPEGPYVDAVGGALLGLGSVDIRGVALSDPSVLIDDADGQAYLYYGRRAPSAEGTKVMMVKLNPDMVSLGAFYGEERSEAGDPFMFKEIKVPKYGDALTVFKREGAYYMMWSEGNPDGDDYKVSYGMATKPAGPFKWFGFGTVLEGDGGIATGTGNAGVVNVPGTDVWYIVYNRRQLGIYISWNSCKSGGGTPWEYCRKGVDAYLKRVAYERMEFTEGGRIKKITMRVHDNFDDSNYEGWAEYTSGDYWVLGGQLHGRQGIAALNTKLYDVVADVDVVLTATEVEQGNAGLVVRMRPHTGMNEEWQRQFTGDDGPDDYEGTYGGISTEGGGKVVVGVASKGFWFPLEEASLPIELGKSYHLRLTARQGDVKLFVDDMVVPRVARGCSNEDSPGGKPMQPNCEYIQSGGGGGHVKWKNDDADHVGYTGVRVYKAAASFDNFRVARYDQSCATNGNQDGCL
ncbi:Arabinanase/levansucrase/invertase [Coniochaeta ligniaria NRRL 30616]|uniref:Arabinanase/levansucrase/invertase n=1 Tax=Coniochaeta ligniaria NRRL 30616 TaxID=1408157 RepID=A0A1J7JPR6_9PEZI|nr:Arabinanase/levansucrase/invertase [Coniochaeta ligniaria NRRL 30616]